jgi:hypothetical protein
MKKILCVVMLFGLMFQFLMAQMNQTGNINGTVSAADGTSLPGVSVTLTSPALIIEKMVAVTNENGRYRFNALAPGEYELVFDLDGMTTIQRKGIRVSIGKTLTLDVQMELKSLQETIVVEGQAPTIDRQSTTRSANLDTSFLNSIPAARNLATVFNMTPGVTGDTAHGSSVRDNSYNLDGVNLTDPVVGTQNVFFGMDIAEEISVQSGGLSAEYGSTRGAVINVVTKSGGNSFSGNLRSFFNHEALMGDNTKGTVLEGKTSGSKYEFEPGFSLGGPIIKDKIWFFMNLSFNLTEDYIAGFPYDKEQEIPNRVFRPYPYFKLTYQPSQSDKFIFSFNHSNLTRNHRNASILHTEDTTWDQKGPKMVFNGHWAHTFNDRVFANLKAAYVKGDLNLTAKNDSPAFLEDADNRRSGGYGYDDLNARTRIQLNADTTIFVENFAGSHEIKIGAEHTAAQSDRYWNPRAKTNQYGFGLVWVYTDGGTAYSSEWVAPWNHKESTISTSFFANDTWNIGRNLNLNLGGRLEFSKGRIPQQGDYKGMAAGSMDFLGQPQYTWNRTISKDETLMNWTSLTPRVGLTYDLFANGSTLIKASYARYVTGAITQFFSGLNRNSFVEYWGACDPITYEVTNFWGAYMVTNYPTMGYGDEKVKAPYVDEISVGIEREFARDWSIGTRYIRKWDRKLIEDADGNQLDMDALMKNGELVWTNWEPVVVTDNSNSDYFGSEYTFWKRKQNLIVDKYVINAPGADRDYSGFEVTLNKRMTNGWFINSSYVYAESTGLIGTDFSDSWGGQGYFDNPNTHENALGRFLLERRHQFKLAGLIQGPAGVNLSAYFYWMSGERYTRQVRSRDLGLSLPQGTTTINAEARGSYGLPAYSGLDLKLEKVFSLGRSSSLKIFCDGFNVLNNNKATSVRTISSSSTMTFGEMMAIQSPRIIRFGLDFGF